MKWSLLLAGLILLGCMGGVGAFSETFQGAISTTMAVATGGDGYASATIINGSGTPPENFYVHLTSLEGSYYPHTNSVTAYIDYGWYLGTLLGTPSDYFAFTTIHSKTTGTIPNSADFSIYVYDEDTNYLGSIYLSSYILNINTPTRIELKRTSSSGQIYLYVNGVDEGLVLTTSVRPWVYGFHLGSDAYSEPQWDIDDIIQEVSSNGYIVGTIPHSWNLKKDTLGSTVNGLYNNNTVIHTSTMNSTYGSGTNLNTNLQLVDTSGTVWQTTPISGYAGSAQFNLTTFFATSAPYGEYKVRIADYIWDTLWYIGTGASISWDQSTYPQGATATISHSITGSYYNTSGYTYKIAVMDVYGTFYGTNISTTAQTGTNTIILSSGTYPEGVYYAELIATPTSGSEIVMTYAAMTVSSYVYLSGYVMNENGVTLPNAFLNITQGSVNSPVFSQSTGNWSSSAQWLSGNPIYIVSNLTGYNNDTRTFTPLSAGPLTINITLWSTNPSYSGAAIGGVIRDNQYGNPVAGATYHTLNGTDTTCTTNIAGVCINNNLVANTLYNVSGSKTGYGNSTYYNVVAVAT